MFCTKDDAVAKHGVPTSLLQMPRNLAPRSSSCHTQRPHSYPGREKYGEEGGVFLSHVYYLVLFAPQSILTIHQMRHTFLHLLHLSRLCRRLHKETWDKQCTEINTCTAQQIAGRRGIRHQGLCQPAFRTTKLPLLLLTALHLPDVSGIGSILFK